MATASASKPVKPIATFGDAAVKAEVHRATFTPFAVLKYLDRAALQKADATIEIGTLAGGGVTVTLAMDISAGVVTGIRPVASASLPKPPKGGASAAAQKKVKLAMLKAAGKAVPVPLDLPKKVALIWDDDPWEIDIGPITIILGGGLSNACINVSSGTDGLVCSYCLFGPPVCSQLGPPF